VPENADPPGQHLVGVCEREGDLGFRSLGEFWIRNTPVASQRMVRPERASVACRSIANRDDKMHCGASGRENSSQLLERAKPGVQPQILEYVDRHRINLSGRIGAGRESFELAIAHTVHRRLGENRPCRIGGAEDTVAVIVPQHLRDLRMGDVLRTFSSRSAY
jgi:hypothetical protein